jgi:hypothetical protein
MSPRLRKPWILSVIVFLFLTLPNSVINGENSIEIGEQLTLATFEPNNPKTVQRNREIAWLSQSRAPSGNDQHGKEITVGVLLSEDHFEDELWPAEVSWLQKDSPAAQVADSWRQRKRESGATG